MVDSKKYTDLVSVYASYIAQPPLVQVTPTTAGTTVKLDLQLVEHPILGHTKIRVREWYDNADQLLQYQDHQTSPPK